MMKKTIVYYFVILISIFCYACEQDPIITSVLPTTVSTPDDIIYTDITDLSLISITGPDLSGMCTVAIPYNYSYSSSIDIDADGVNDMDFLASHWIATIGSSDPCKKYNCSISVSMSNSSDTIARNINGSMWIKQLSLNDTVNISTAGYYFPFASLFINNHSWGGFPPVFNNFTGEKYIGFKMLRSGKTMFGWVRIESIGYNGVIIKDFAVNKTDNNTILCGQQF